MGLLLQALLTGSGLDQCYYKLPLLVTKITHSFVSFGSVSGAQVIKFEKCINSEVVGSDPANLSNVQKIIK